MAKQMELTATIRIFNRLAAWMISRGLSKKRALLTTLGRKSGELRTTPVQPSW